MARSVAAVVAGLRVALGLAALAAPDLVARPWIGGHGTGPGRRVLARALGGRDMALGLGALLALRRGAPLRGWVEAAALSDTLDACATLLDLRHLPPGGRMAVLGASGGAAITGVLAARSL